MSHSFLYRIAFSLYFQQVEDCNLLIPYPTHLLDDFNEIFLPQTQQTYLPSKQAEIIQVVYESTSRVYFLFYQYKEVVKTHFYLYNIRQLMEREQAQRRFNLEPIICPTCKRTEPSYRFFLFKDAQIKCYTCSTNDRQILENAVIPLKEHYQKLFKQLPLPDYRVGKSCLDALVALRQKAGKLMEGIKARIAAFEAQLEDFLKQSQVICQSYLQKVKKVEESKINDWLKHPPRFIDQQRFISNIKQKQRTAAIITDSLEQFQITIPNLGQIKQRASEPRQISITPKNNITSATIIRGSLYFGDNNGDLFFQQLNGFKSIKAHQTLIRAMTHDQQFGLFSGSDDQSIKLWNIRGEEPQIVKAFGTIPDIKSYQRHLAMIPNIKSLVSSRGQFDDHQIRIWELSNYSNSKTFEGHEGYIRGLIVDDSNRIVSASQDRYLKVWDIKTCECINSYFHNSKIHYLFSHAPSHSYLIIDQGNRMILLDQQTLQIFHGHYLGKKILMANANTFIYIHADRYLYILDWNLNMQEKIDFGGLWNSTNILQNGPVLCVTDVHGFLHQYQPLCLKN